MPVRLATETDAAALIALDSVADTIRARGADPHLLRAGYLLSC